MAVTDTDSPEADALYTGWSDCHDYDPRWDYDDELRPAWQEHPLLRYAQGQLDASGEIGRVFAADLSARHVVAIYIDGTGGNPVILLDPLQHARCGPDARFQVGRSIDHELRHARQDQSGEDYDEDDAEHGA